MRRICGLTIGAISAEVTVTYTVGYKNDGTKCANLPSNWYAQWGVLSHLAIIFLPKRGEKIHQPPMLQTLNQVVVDANSGICYSKYILCGFIKD
jgi:hypothetical protein